MKLVRYRSATGEEPGLILDGVIFDLSGSFSSLNPRAPRLDDIEAIAAIPAKALSKAPKNVVLGPPLRGIGKIIGVGLNYRDHAEETGLPLPKEPTLFLKATSALCGPTDDLVMPREARSVDWEVELAVVIGKSGV
jgi:2-keto-4-pentenoate hydratase/2-oxohepta-3-ene-1,7-dioic acid hydratase in catechol pathway